MTKIPKSKLKCPEGWTILLTANKYQALHKATGYETELVGEKEEAIMLAIRQAQQMRWDEHKAKKSLPSAGDSSAFAEAVVAEAESEAEAKSVRDIRLSRKKAWLPCTPTRWPASATNSPTAILRSGARWPL